MPKSTRSWIAAALLVISWVLSASLTPTAAQCELDRARGVGYVESHFLVRLSLPLDKRDPDGAIMTKTGLTMLDDMIVKTGVHKIDRALRVSLGTSDQVERHRQYGLDRLYRFHVPEGRDISALVEQFSRLPGVELAEPDYIDYASGLPDDPLFGEQWGLDQSNDADIDAPEGWELATGNGVLIALLDSGVDASHPELADRLELEHAYDFVEGDAEPDDDAQHGTGTASIIAAKTNNGAGMAGACWNCRLMPLKVLDENGEGAISRFFDAVVWAVDNGARVISYGAAGCDAAEIRLAAVRYAYDSGVMIVAPAANLHFHDVVEYPAKYVETIAVGSTDRQDAHPTFSNFGSELDVVAPGDGIVAAAVGGGFSSVSGTSYSAALVAGMVGVMHSLDPALGLRETQHLIRSGAEDQLGDPAKDTPGHDDYHGWGRVNLERTLQATQSSNSLRVEGTNPTRLTLTVPNRVAESYDFIRGDLGGLSESIDGVDLGEVVCLKNDARNPEWRGHEDRDVPRSGEGFFYLSRFNAAPGAGSYGGSSQNRDRRPTVPQSVAASWTADAGQPWARFGRAVDRAGDINNDGYEDVIFGAPGYKSDGLEKGGALLYLGSPTGLQPTPAWVAEGPAEGSEFGAYVASAGDINGDGHDDAIVGAPMYTNGEFWEGGAFVYLGSEGGLSHEPDWAMEGNQELALLGLGVDTAGDVDGDGYGDVIVNAALFSNGEMFEGRASVYHGSADGLDSEPAWTFETNQEFAAIERVASAGDVNGDGYGDVILGTVTQPGQSKSWVFFGGPDGLSPEPSVTLALDPETYFVCCIDVAGAGDVNGDGYDDVLLWGITGPFLRWEGAAVLFLGSPTGPSSTPDWVFGTGQEAAERLSFGSAGDVNADGYGDVVIGSFQQDGERSDQGGVWVFLGGPSGLSRRPAWHETGRRAGAQFGAGVAGADTNGDGSSDVVVGAPFFDDGRGGPEGGRAFLYLGPDLGQMRVRPNDCER